MFIFYKLVYRYKINSLFYEFSESDHTASLFYLVFALLLVFFNWGIESYKWQRLILKYEKLSFKSAFKAVLSGVSLSIITPNQIGDFAGRVIHLQVLNKIKGSLVTVIGHTAQVLVTCFFGLFAVWHLLLRSDAGILAVHKININTGLVNFDAGYGHYFIPVFFIFLSLLAVWLYLNLQYVYIYLRRFHWVIKFEKYIEVFGAYKSKELSIILFISFLRYLVFLLQYYLLLLFFDVHIQFLTAISCIVATFCIQSMVPSFFLLEIGLRGASALWFFGMFSTHTSGILMAAYSLWIINMMMPALLGMWFIYKVRS
ncbi:MAG: flippase-like domain-containing protein [Bacteroidia bacterium]|nr:flippase-like domain-containing protein [Bacteroidia bacterium]